MRRGRGETDARRTGRGGGRSEVGSTLSRLQNGGLGCHYHCRRAELRETWGLARGGSWSACLFHEFHLNQTSRDREGAFDCRHVPCRAFSPVAGAMEFRTKCLSDHDPLGGFICGRCGPRGDGSGGSLGKCRGADCPFHLSRSPNQFSDRA